MIIVDNIEEPKKKLDITDSLAGSGRNVLMQFCKQKTECTGCCFNTRLGCACNVPRMWLEVN